MKILLLDIETAPHKVYSWGLFNQNIAINQIEEPGYTLCWSAKWYKDDNVMFSSLYSDGREIMLRLIHAALDNADVVVHYNGTKFDIPTLNQEFLAVGLTPPSPVIEIDLLKTARKRFRFPSNKLSYVAEYLGLGSKVRHKGMELWRKCMQKDGDAWATMEAYNVRDVELLEKVYDKLKPWVTNHPNHALFTEDERPVCTNCGGEHVQRRGRYYTKTLSYQRYACMDCGTWMRARLTDLSLEKRRGVLVGVS